MRSRLPHLGLALAGGILLAACGTGSGCGDPSVTLEVTVTAESMEPSSLSVCRDQAVVLVISSETDGEFHLHGFDEQVGEVALEPGEQETVEFVADSAGQFIIELHDHDGAEAEIGVLTVNEP